MKSGCWMKRCGHSSGLPWEAQYKRGGPGQPPIHLQVLAGIWLYAMMRRIRTSRPLEYACGHNVDFMWLAEGRTPDYSTLATFFSSNKEPLRTSSNRSAARR
jgi:transposase